MYKQAKPYLQTMHNKSVQAHHKAQNTTKHYNRINLRHNSTNKVIP